MTQLLWYTGYEILLADIVRAENCHLYDARGRRYIDMESGVWSAQTISGCGQA